MLSQTESTTRKETSEAFNDFRARMMSLFDAHDQVSMAEIAALQKENATLREENTALRQVNATLQATKEVWAQFAALERRFANLQVDDAPPTTPLAFFDAVPAVSTQQQASQ